MENEGFARISIAAAQALANDKDADFAVFLSRPGNEGRLLYRESGAGLSLPDFEKLRSNGVEHLYVRAEDVQRCESLLEVKLHDVVANPHLPPEEKAKLVQHVGTMLARDLTGENVALNRIPEKLDRAAHVVDAVIGCVLRDPVVAAHLLRMGAHERGTASHMFIVSALSVMLGAEVYGSDKRMLTDLGVAGMMHDIGKLGISPEILNKQGPLTFEELQLIHQHPVESVRLLGNDPHVTPAVRQMILQHHEWVDGRGYPTGVSGLDLLPGSRIVAIVDTFHAMIGRRSYRAAVTPVEANRAMNAQAGRQFDAELLACWNALFQRCWVQAGFPSVDVLEENADDASGKHEHRASRATRRDHRNRPKRQPCKNPVNVACLYAGRLHDATAAPDRFVAAVYDISRSGLCLYSEHPMYRGEALHVRLQQRGGHIWVRSRVAWCRQHEPNQFRVGLRFVKRLTDSEVAQSVEVAGMGGLEVTVPGRAAGGSLYIRSNYPVRPMARNQDALNCLAAIAATRPVKPEAERTAVMLATSPDTQVRRKAIDVLAGLGTKTARAALLNSFRDPEPTVRERAIGAAGALRMVEAAHLLKHALKDANQAIALRAAGALGRIGERDGLDLARRFLLDDGRYARLAAQVFGDIVGHRFAANVEGVKAARRYLSVHESALGAA